MGIKVKKRETSRKKGSVDKEAERTHSNLEKAHKLDLQHKENRRITGGGKVHAAWLWGDGQRQKDI